MNQTDTIKILVTKRKRKGEKNGKPIKWIQFLTPMSLVVKGEESKGKQKKWVNTVFCGDELKKTAEKIITRGEIDVKVSDISYPKKWEITQDENGKDVYPVVKVYGFSNFNEKLIEMENPFITEDETEEKEIEDVADNSEESNESQLDLPDENAEF